MVDGKIIYDVQKREAVAGCEPGIRGFISFGRLVDVLRQSREFGSDIPTHLIVTSRGIEIAYGTGGAKC